MYKSNPDRYQKEKNETLVAGIEASRNSKTPVKKVKCYVLAPVTCTAILPQHQLLMRYGSLLDTTTTPNNVENLEEYFVSTVTVVGV